MSGYIQKFRDSVAGRVVGATMLATAAVGGATGGALADDGKTVAEVVNLPNGGAVQYIYNKAYERTLALGQKFGDSAVQCLGREFIQITKDSNGNVILPTGLNNTIDAVFTLNSAGHADTSAEETINDGVNWVATNVCDLPADLVRTASLDN